MNEPEFYERADLEWAWRVVNKENGDVVGNDGGQGFRDKHDAQRAFEDFLRGLVYNVDVALPTTIIRSQVDVAAGEGDGANET